jgi:hypothetical protein
VKLSFGEWGMGLLNKMDAFSVRGKRTQYSYWLVEKAPMEETLRARPQVCGCAISTVVRMATALMTF